MANQLYPKGREKIASGSVIWNTDNIKILLVSISGTGSYTPNFGTDEFKTDIPSTAILGTSINLSGKSSLLGVYKAANLNVTPTSSTGTVGAILIFKDSGTDSTSPLIGYIDSVTNFPLALNGGDVQVNWDTGAFGIFRI